MALGVNEVVQFVVKRQALLVCYSNFILFYKKRYRRCCCHLSKITNYSAFFSLNELKNLLTSCLLITRLTESFI